MGEEGVFIDLSIDDVVWRMTPTWKLRKVEDESEKSKKAYDRSGR
jgi:hypothetical protein